MLSSILHELKNLSRSTSRINFQSKLKCTFLAFGDGGGIRGGDSYIEGVGGIEGVTILGRLWTIAILCLGGSSALSPPRLPCLKILLKFVF